MMHSCASAAEFLGGGTILSLGAKAMAGCGSPPPRIVAPLERKVARRGKKKLLFSKAWGKPRSLSSPGVRRSGSRPRVEQLDADQHGPVLVWGLLCQEEKAFSSRRGQCAPLVVVFSFCDGERGCG